MKNFFASLVIVLVAFAAGRYFFPAAPPSAEAGLTNVLFKTDELPDRATEIASSQLSVDNEESSVVSPNYTTEELHTIRLFEAASPSVCYITTRALSRSFWSYGEVESGSGSGFVWDQQGHIITNFHVISGSRTSGISVTLANGESYEAQVIGFEKEKDLAVLKIDAPRSVLQPINVGTSSNIRVGQSVYAIGNPFGLDQTLTTGVVSALDREIQSQARVPIKGAIQTDAAINPGNSGGPLLDSQGRLIGVNTAIYSPSGASAGIGFSIPVDVVRFVVPDLIRYGEVRRATLGLDLRQYGRVKGLIVFAVDQASGAAQAGIRGLSRDRRGSLILGDVLVGINGQTVRSNSDIYLELEKYQPGDIVEVNLVRDERRVDVRMRLGSSVG